MKTTWDLNDTVEIILPDNDSFLKIKETLQRIGIPSHKTKNLYQTAHILHKRGKYYIIHFKCLFALDGKSTVFDGNDWKRQNRIANLLVEWGLCSYANEGYPKEMEDISKIKILKHAEKGEWKCCAKYQIGI